MGKFSGLLLASDMDGTLFEGGILGRDRDAIARFIGGGGTFTVATGRTRLAMKPLIGLFGINAPAVLGNGAFICDLETGEITYRRPLEEGYIPFAEAALDAGASVEVHYEDEVWVINPNEINAAHFELIGAKAVAAGSLDEPPKPWLKAVFVAEEPLIAKLRADITPKLGGRYSVVASVPVFLELMHPDANKGSAVERLRVSRGIDKENVYVIGDNNNDIPMLSRFRSFCPASGADDAKAAAGTTVRAAKDGAVSHAIELIEEERG